jgi:hypothetical protein
MRNRSRPSEQHQEQSEQQEQQRERSVARERPTGAEPERERSARVRIPKIQYRFLKEMEEHGVSNQARHGALGMADKIKSFPVGERAVMGSWERFTKTAIEAFKSGTGDGAERDRRHAAYALLFSVLREKAPANTRGELKQRIDSFVVAAQHGRPAPSSPPLQQELPRERSLVERQVDATIARLRELSPELRSQASSNAERLLLAGETAATARAKVPDAIRDLKAQASEENAARAFALALTAKTQSREQLAVEMRELPSEQFTTIRNDGHQELARYADQKGDERLEIVRKDAIAARVLDALEGTALTHRLALVRGSALEELEAANDPSRTKLAHVAEQLASELP